MNDVRSQLDQYFSYVDAAQGSVDVLDVVESVVPLPIESVQHRWSGRGGWLVAAAAATLVLVLVGGLGLLTRIVNDSEDAPVVDDPVVTTTLPAVTSTTVADALEETPPVVEEPPIAGGSELRVTTPWSAEDLPADAETGTLDTPLGTASWVKLPADEDTRPGFRCVVFDEEDGYGGCGGPGDVMPWPSGFAFFESSFGGYPPPARPVAPARLWVSENGVEWREEPLPSRAVATGGSLTLDNGVYWLQSEEPAGLWFTTDGSTWHEVDPTGLAPPGSSVDPTWERGYAPPVTAGELTLTYGEFSGDEYPRDHEQSLYIIGDTDVTPVDVPWPDMVSVTLFSTGDRIYAYTDNGQAPDAAMTVWRTADGRTWAEMGPPSFVAASGLTGGKSFYLYPTLDGRLVAWSHELRGSAWETTDGLTWDAVDLPPLPSAKGADEPSPIRLGTDWYAVTGGLGSSWDGHIWWAKTGDSWFKLTEIPITGVPIWATGIGHTTFFFNEESMWVMNLDATR